MKGIILAGGRNTRLYPITMGVNKQPLPVYDKPMVFYPLSMLMMAGIRDILVISTPVAMDTYKRLLADGSQWGVHFSYTEQPEAHGLAEAFILGREFIGNEPVCLILGDNIFYGHGLEMKLRTGAGLSEGAMIFAYPVRDPQRYGVVEFDDSGKAVSIEEKPLNPRSRYAVPGIYFYDRSVIGIAENLHYSDRGELEITDVNRAYMERNQLVVEPLGRGIAWLDAGTHESLLQAANFIQAVQERLGIIISSPEEIAYRMGYIGFNELERSALEMKNSRYGQYLLHLLEEESSPIHNRSQTSGSDSEV